ncbi:hypothetical protein [Mycolicibacterium phlei]|jgi:hypothetical protein
MSTLRAILELQGSLDTAVVATGDPRVAAIADRFFPGTSANPNWYREIEAFLFSNVPDESEGPRTEADPSRALVDLFPTPRESDPVVTIPESSRLLYGLGALIHLTRTGPTEILPFHDPTIPPEDEDEDPSRMAAFNAVADLLEFVAPARRSDTEALPRERRVSKVVEVFVDEFTGWQDWTAVTKSLVDKKLLKAEIAAVPLCTASVVTVNGVECATIDTDFTSTEVSLEKVKKVVDPNNWDDNYPHFFCEMQYHGLRPDGWRRVLETVGFCANPFSTRLVTMLKYYKSTPSPTDARLDYDLDDPAPHALSDGIITVDKGFVNMWAPDGDPTKPPCRVRTRKVAHITGLRSYTIARFICVSGYAYAALEMIFGNAKNPPPGFRPWEEDPAELPAAGTGNAAQATPAPEPHPTNSVASTTIKMLTECVEQVTAQQFDLAEKWLSGKLTVEDLAKHSTDLGARIASEPFRIMAAIAKGKGAGQ